MKGFSLLLFSLFALSLGAESSSEDLASLYFQQAWYSLENPVGYSKRFFQSPSRNGVSEKALIASLSFQSEYGDALWLQGQFYERTGRPALAEKNFRTALKQGVFRRVSTLAVQESLLTLLQSQGRWQDILDLWPRQTGTQFSPVSAMAFIDAYYFTGQKDSFKALLSQAVGLFPEDNRFLVPMLRSPSSFPLLEKKLKKAQINGSILSQKTILQVIRDFDSSTEDPKVLWNLLKKLAYDSPDLAAWGQLLGEESSTSLFPQDYGILVRLAMENTLQQPVPNGVFTWDRSGDGIPDQRIILDGNNMIWEKDQNQDGFWEIRMTWVDGRLSTLEETGEGTRGIFAWEDYPHPATMTVMSKEKTLILDFGSYQGSMDLWDNEIPKSLPLWLLPSAIEGKLGFQVQPDSWDLERLTPLALRIKEYSSKGIWKKTSFQLDGQVYYSEESVGGRGKKDRITFYVGGAVEAVYLDLDQDGNWDFWEKQENSGRRMLLSKLNGNLRSDWAFIDKIPGSFQLWDFQKDGIVDLQLFSFPDGGSLKVLPLGKTEFDWGAMPLWEDPITP